VWETRFVFQAALMIFSFSKNSNEIDFPFSPLNDQSIALLRWFIVWKIQFLDPLVWLYYHIKHSEIQVQTLFKLNQIIIPWHILQYYFPLFYSFKVCSKVLSLPSIVAYFLELPLNCPREASCQALGDSFKQLDHK